MTPSQTEVGGGAIAASVDTKYYLDRVGAGRPGQGKGKERVSDGNQSSIENDYEDLGAGSTVN